ncbi:uncharacterized protein LOC111613507 [Centruroides sculpturatus]|uniref:uncharacterized protein LOC111613507 n=1 Tax=Centruroides sculpturatus TaxID=218467 RepID=UPI000C6E14EC|nr:uncharacterized protein LOC111613507 [Centruroides sculpturatus]
MYGASCYEISRSFADLPHPALRRGLGTHDCETSIEVFTDGSKTAQGTASAFVVYVGSEESHHDTLPLHPECSVFQAEMFAVFKAIEFCNKIFNCNITIFTDSQAMVQVLTNKDTTHPLARDTLFSADQSSNNYHIKWIKGHCGTPGNERADFLAHVATSFRDINPVSRLEE